MVGLVDFRVKGAGRGLDFASSLDQIVILPRVMYLHHQVLISSFVN